MFWLFIRKAKIQLYEIDYHLAFVGLYEEENNDETITTKFVIKFLLALRKMYLLNNQNELENEKLQ